MAALLFALILTLVS
ncbi:hypothetical protein HRG08_12645 [Enterococcus faecalis]|nr:hypothetical protein [Enterococcus faecalis]